MWLLHIHTIAVDKFPRPEGREIMVYGEILGATLSVEIVRLTEHRQHAAWLIWPGGCSPLKLVYQKDRSPHNA